MLRRAGARYRRQLGYGALRQLVTSTPECLATAGSSPDLAVALRSESGGEAPDGTELAGHGFDAVPDSAAG
ncbi:hypothetical protein ACFV0O_02145 [Kitasatospora sp. NPDC059577]|uniref:hypothetical protein n=1 Tax=Kitasatospora sp. NPDC059577 TaxID=3346873 RepID=UPI0036BFE486